MLLLYNPKSGTGEFEENLGIIVNKFTKADFLLSIYPTQFKKDAYDKTLKHAKDFDYLVCSGGDGTLSEVVSALMCIDMKLRPIFAYIPSGTTNDFASSLEIPLDINLAVDLICNGYEKLIDIGSFNDQYFAYVAAFGLFTDVSYDTPQSMKNMLGHMAYMLEGVKRLSNIKAFNCKIECDGEVFEDKYLFGMVSNSLSVGGFKLPYKNTTAYDDGKFELLLLKEFNSFSDVQDTIAVLLENGKNIQSHSFIFRSAKKIKIVAQKPLKWTLDGEFGGKHLDISINIINKALRIIVP